MEAAADLFSAWNRCREESPGSQTPFSGDLALDVAGLVSGQTTMAHIALWAIVIGHSGPGSPRYHVRSPFRAQQALIGWVEGITGAEMGMSEDADLKLCLAQWPEQVLRAQLGQSGGSLWMPCTRNGTLCSCQAIVSYGRDYLVRVKGNRPTILAALADGFPEAWGNRKQRPKKKSVEIRRLWLN